MEAGARVMVSARARRRFYPHASAGAVCRCLEGVARGAGALAELRRFVAAVAKREDASRPLERRQRRNARPGRSSQISRDGT